MLLSLLPCFVFVLLPASTASQKIVFEFRSDNVSDIVAPTVPQQLKSSGIQLAPIIEQSVEVTSTPILQFETTDNKLAPQKEANINVLGGIITSFASILSTPAQSIEIRDGQLQEQEGQQEEALTYESLFSAMNSQKRLGFFADAMEAAGLSSILNNKSLQYTIFAPTNFSFQKVFGENLSKQQFGLARVEVLRNMLSYHIVPTGKFDKNMLKNDQKLSTLVEGESLTTIVSENIFAIQADTNRGNILDFDLFGGKGVIHVIDVILDYIPSTDISQNETNVIKNEEKIPNIQGTKTNSNINSLAPEDEKEEEEEEEEEPQKVNKNEEKIPNIQGTQTNSNIDSLAPEKEDPNKAIMQENVNVLDVEQIPMFVPIVPAPEIEKVPTPTPTPIVPAPKIEKVPTPTPTPIVSTPEIDEKAPTPMLVPTPAPSLAPTLSPIPTDEREQVIAEAIDTVINAIEVGGLEIELMGAQSYTIFAPTAAAFNTFLASYQATDMADIPKKILQDTILQHVVIGSYIQSDFTNTTKFNNNEEITLQSMQGPFLRILLQKNSTLISSIGAQANIVISDLSLQNLMVHIIDNVLIPFAPEEQISNGICSNVSPDFRYDCSEQKEFGKCEELWMSEGNYCRESCGECGDGKLNKINKFCDLELVDELKVIVERLLEEKSSGSCNGRELEAVLLQVADQILNEL